MKQKKSAYALCTLEVHPEVSFICFCCCRAAVSMLWNLEVPFVEGACIVVGVGREVFCDENAPGWTRKASQHPAHPLVAGP